MITTPIVLGLDQAPNLTGWATQDIEGYHYGVIHAPAEKKLPAAWTSQSFWMASQIARLIENICPDYVALEGLFLGKNPGVLMTLAEFRGMLLWVCLERKIEVVSVSAPELTKHLGLHVGVTRKQRKARSQFMATAMVFGNAHALQENLIGEDESDALNIWQVAQARLNLERMVAESEG